MYRPTVRMADAFQDYVDQLHKITRLDRNQIIRLALFAAAYSEPFREILEEYKTADVPIPSPAWELYEDQFFLEKDPKAAAREEGKGEDVLALAQREAAAAVEVPQPVAVVAPAVEKNPEAEAKVRKVGKGVRIDLRAGKQ